MVKHNVKYWKKQLDKYFEAQTSREEEAELKNYFTSDNIAPHLAKYQALFVYFSREKEEISTKQFPRFNANKTSNTKKWISVAAGVLLIFTAYTGIKYYKERQEARRAYEDTMYAFRLIAENVKTGRKEIRKLQVFEQTTNKIFKTSKK